MSVIGSLLIGDDLYRLHLDQIGLSHRDVGLQRVIRAVHFRFQNRIVRERCNQHPDDLFHRFVDDLGYGVLVIHHDDLEAVVALQVYGKRNIRHERYPVLVAYHVDQPVARFGKSVSP